jgi:hypothetical protein
VTLALVVAAAWLARTGWLLCGRDGVTGSQRACDTAARVERPGLAPLS